MIKLLGVDIGFSKARNTTGIACLNSDTLHLWKAGSSWESRKAQVPVGFQADVIALDGPILPQGVNELVRRRCEFIFIRTPFWNRCKPGLSHFGFGLKLRRATAEASVQFSRLLVGSTRTAYRVFDDSYGSSVEAFPNAFLAVLLPEQVFRAMPKLKRGQKFDWLYERAIETGRLASILSKSLDLPDDVWRTLNSENDHERRAALVCLLTAAFAARGSAQKVGDTEGGWFWLPPLDLWQDWAKDGLNRAVEDLRSKGSHSPLLK